MGIDRSFLKFVFALIIVGFVIELIDNIDHKAAILLVIVLETGILLNNQLALALLNVSAASLGEQVK